jgi:hypothetical protein
VDGNAETLRGTTSVLNGIKPVIKTSPIPDGEAVAVGEWLADYIAEGMPPAKSGSSCATTAS